MTRRLMIATISAVCLPPFALAAWESQLFPFDVPLGRYEEQSVSFAGRTWELPDHSYVGYALGELAPASGVPCVVETIVDDGDGDITAELQAAIDLVGAGGGGVVAIPAGSYTMGASVAVTAPNVSIEGAGSALTTVNVPSSYSPVTTRYEGLFTFGKPLGGWSKGWIEQGALLTDVVTPVEAGDLSITVLDPASLALGDWIVVRQFFWPAFSAANSQSPNAWDSFNGWPDPPDDGERLYSFTYLRQITGISGSVIDLDAPIPWRLDPADNPIKIQSAEDPDLLANVGVSGLTIFFADNFDVGIGRPVGAGVYFEGVRDGWVHDVQVHNIPRYGFYIESSARISVIDSAVLDAQDYGTGGWGYGFHIETSQNVLVRDSYAEETRHGFVSQRALTSSIVLSDNHSAAAREGGDDTHHSWIHGLLWDHHRMSHGTGLHSLMRGSTSGGAYETLGSAVLWNVHGDGCRGGWFGGSVQLNPASDGSCIVVGGPGGHEVWDVNEELGTGERMTALHGMQVATTDDGPGLGKQDRNVLYEGLYREELTPASLYEAQLANRVGTGATSFVGACGTTPVAEPIVPKTYPGYETHVFDSDHLGWVPRTGSGCLDCEIDSTALNHTPSGSESMHFEMVNPTDFKIAATFRGCAQTTADFESLRLFLMPQNASFELRVTLVDSPLPEGNDSNLGYFTIDGLTAGVWNEVVIPMTEFSAGAFNAVQFRSRGAQTSGEFFIDDIALVPVPAPPPPVPDGVDGTPMTVERLDGAGQSLRIHWDTLSCDTARDHHLLYGNAAGLPAAPGGAFTLQGEVCDLGRASPHTWSPSPSGTGLLWWLIVADDDGPTQGSLGRDSTGSERTGTLSCGTTVHDTSRACGLTGSP